jgi:hypothetical protein
MKKITKDKAREIIDDFVSEIQNRKKTGHKPPTTVIDFRDDRIIGKERNIELVPIDLLRYRKDNGRISSDIASYEHFHGVLDETSKKHQEIIRDFLWKKDPEKTNELLHSILHYGQDQPAIITCDGFLINGNRRKMVMEELLKKYPGNEKFKNMKVVILPGKDDEGGPPTLLEIEQIENRYQYHSEGKAEYYGFDRALSMRRKMDLGMTLEEQLRDDPQYAGLDDKDFKKAVRQIKENYLMPLECIDRYLSLVGRVGVYDTVSTSYADREGRWQAFIDYSKFYQQLKDDKKRVKLGINEDEVGDIEDVAFKIIRKRDLKISRKVHDIMRDLPKLVMNKDSKREILRIKHIDSFLPEEDLVDKDGNEYDLREIDRIWGEKNAEDIIRQVKKATDLLDFKNIKETPITLLEDALKKLNHKDMDPETINPSDIPKAMKLSRDIQKCANELENKFYHFEKDWKKKLERLDKKFNK